MWKEAAKEDYRRTLGLRLLRIPNYVVLEDPEEFVRKVRSVIGVEGESKGAAKINNPSPGLPATRDRPPSP